MDTVTDPTSDSTEASNSDSKLPELPRGYIDTTFALPTGNVITVSAGENFQAALDRANLGGVIVLEAGATFQGPFTLPNKTTGSGWIYIISSAYNRLPPPGTRVSPSDASSMPSINVTSGGSAIRTADNAHHYRFVGIEFSPAEGNFVHNLIQIGNADTTEKTLPYNIFFDRCYIHGDPVLGGRRGMAMDGKSIAVIDSYVSGFIQTGFDTQALWAYNTPGPLKIVNSYLEGAGENVMFGGAIPKINNCVPADIEIRHNHFHKPLVWKERRGTVKNLFELKNAKRVLVERNIFENNWVDSQNGFAILFTVRGERGAAPWAAVQDVTFRYNKIINSENGFNLLGRDPKGESGVQTRILIKDNLLLDVPGKIFQVLNGVVDLTIDHNTAVSGTHIAMHDGTPKNDGFVFTNNMLQAGNYGFHGSVAGEGNPCLAAYYEEGWTFEKNIIIGGHSNRYPQGNWFPPDRASVGFIKHDEGNYRLATDSPFKMAGTDGKDIGADLDAIEAATTDVRTGKPE
ncbi:hypothetical protein ACFL0S_04325 [Thermodesulfobacteriota bacterium]